MAMGMGALTRNKSVMFSLEYLPTRKGPTGEKARLLLNTRYEEPNIIREIL